LALVVVGIIAWVWGLPKLMAAISKRVFYSSEAAEIKLFCDEHLTFETSATPEQIAESIRQHVTTDSGVPVLGADVKVKYTDHSVIFVCKNALQVFFSAGIAWEDLGDHRRVAWGIAQWREVNGRAMGLSLLRKLRQEVIAAMEALPGPNGEPHAVVGGLAAAAISAAAAGTANAPLDPLSAEAGKRREKALGPLQWGALGTIALGFAFFYFNANTLGWVSFGAAGAIFFLADRAGKMALRAQADPNAAPLAGAQAASGQVPEAPPVPPMPSPAPAAPVPSAAAAPIDAPVPAPATAGKRLKPAIVVLCVVGALLVVGVIVSTISNRTDASMAELDAPIASAPADTASGNMDVEDSTTDAARTVPVEYAARVTREGGEGGTLFDLPAEGQTRAVNLVGFSTANEDGATVVEVRTTSEPVETYALALSQDWFYYIDGTIANSALFAGAVAPNRPITATLGDYGILNMNVAVGKGGAQAVKPAAGHFATIEDLAALAPSDGSERTFYVAVSGIVTEISEPDALDFALVDGDRTIAFEISVGDFGPGTSIDGSGVDPAALVDLMRQSEAHMGTVTITREGIKSFDILSTEEGGDI
jgi:hypothetical protein